MIRFLALGDSYTIGERVDPAERWPDQLTRLLRDTGVSIEDPVIVARTGWTTDELMAALDQAQLDAPYDLVSLLIGVNNQYRGRDTETYRMEFATLLERAFTYAGRRPTRVLVVSIPDWGVTPYAEGRNRAEIAAAIDLFNRVNREETDRRGIRYIDITPISRQAPDDASLLAPDGLHPSGKMYAAWAKRMLPVVRNMLQIGE